MARGLLILLLIFQATAAPFSAHAQAQSEADQLREQLRQTVLQLRALQDSQSAAAAQQQAGGGADLDAAKKDLGRTKAKLEASARKAQALQAQLDQEKARSAQATDELQKAQAELAQYQQALAQASEAAKTAAAQRDQLQASLSQTTATLGACQAKNADLLAVSRELLAAYASVDMRAVLRTREPFLGLKRVELENFAQDYDDRIHNGLCPSQPAEGETGTRR